MDKRVGIAVAGTLLVDRINEINSYPKSGELTSILAVSRAVGGCVPNVSVDLKRLCPSLPVFAYGLIGDDDDGDFLLRALGEYGVGCDGVRKTQNATSFTNVISVRGGQRTFFTYPGASAEFDAACIDFSRVSAKLLHLGYFLLLDKIDRGDGVRLLSRAKEAGIETSVDLVTDHDGRYALVRPALPFTDNLIVNETEAGGLAGMACTPENMRAVAEKLMQTGVGSRVVIHTPQRAVCLSKTGYTELSSFDLPQGFIRGTTGAGDAFCAGCLVGIHDGKSDREILRLGTVAALGALSAPDSVSGMRTFEELSRYPFVQNSD